MTDDQLESRFRALLNRMARSRRLPNEYREEAPDEAVAEVGGFPRESRVLDALDRAIGADKRRRAEAVYLLAALTEIPGAVDRVGDLLREGDAEARAWLVQVIGNRGLVALAPALNAVMRSDPDEHCREFAVRAAGQLQVEVNLPALLALADDPGPVSEYSRVPAAVLWALKDFARPECRPALERAFAALTVPEDRAIAAWGLCKTGPHPAAHAFLVGLLGDEHRDAEGDFDVPSLRAAQGLADLHGWPFEWGAEGRAPRAQTTLGCH